MKFNIIFIFIFLTSCASNITKIENRSPYNSKGFAYIYNDQDYEKKIISFKLDNAKEQISVYNLKMNSLIKIINPKTKESLTLNNYKRIKYPDFYKILITEKVAKKLLGLGCKDFFLTSFEEALALKKITSKGNVILLNGIIGQSEKKIYDIFKSKISCLISILLFKIIQ